MWASGQRHGTVRGRRYAVSSFAGVWGRARLYTPLWLPLLFVFPVCVPRRGEKHTCTCVGAWALLMVVCGSLLTHVLFGLLLPCVPYANGCAGAGMFSLLHPLVGHTPWWRWLSLCSRLRGVARHATYLRLC